MKVVISALGIVAVAGVAVWGLAEFGFQMDAAYAPRYEDVRRQTFEHSRAFNEGNIRDLQNLQLEYARGDEAQKSAIRSVARDRLADVSIDDLPPSLRTFARDMESAQ